MPAGAPPQRRQAPALQSRADPPAPVSHADAADVNVNNPKEYWDYENLQIEWG